MDGEMSAGGAVGWAARTGGRTAARMRIPKARAPWPMRGQEAGWGPFQSGALWRGYKIAGEPLANQLGTTSIWEEKDF